MLNLIGRIVEFALDMAGMLIDLFFSTVGLFFDVLGGFLSLVLGVSVIGLIAGLIAVVKLRRKQPAGETRAAYDVDSEEFVSFYDQFREE